MAASIKDVRYQLEHIIFPKWFFEDPINMSKQLKETHLMAYHFHQFCKQLKIDCPYKIEDFKTTTTLKDNVLIITVHMPEPEKSTQCFRIHFVFDKINDVFLYITIEKGEDTSLLAKFFGLTELPKEMVDVMEQNVLCSWDKDKIHHNYGSIENDINAEYNKILEILKYEIKAKNSKKE